VDFSSLSFLLEKEENHCLQEKHHCHHHAVVIEAKLSEEQEEPQRIDWVPGEFVLPTPRREQREQQFHEHFLMMDALRHSISKDEPLYGCMYTLHIWFWSTMFDFISKLHKNRISQL
jgi:hypothetical protein